MKQALFAMVILPTLAAVAQARPVEWQAELDHCRSLREQMAPLLRAGVGVSAVARSGTAVRRCVWIERRALRHGARLAQIVRDAIEIRINHTALRHVLACEKRQRRELIEKLEAAT